MDSGGGDRGLDLSAIGELVEAAGSLALDLFRTPIVADDKGGTRGYDPVTAADRGIEDRLRSGLAAMFPDDEILGEEFGRSGPQGARYLWLIDPIDGTKAFVTGSPLWGVLLGLLDFGSGRSPEGTGRPVAGWIHQPYLEETFSGSLDDGAWLERRGERRPLRTREGVGIDEAVLYCTSPAMFTAAAESAAFEAVRRRVRLVRYGGDCYAYAQLAMGHVDLVLDAGLQPYDIVPIIPIVEAAGGVVSGPDGASAAGGGFVITAASPALHDTVLALIHDLGVDRRDS